MIYKEINVSSNSSLDLINVRLSQIILVCLILAGLIPLQNQAFGQQNRIIELTFDNAVNLALNNSYRIQEIQLGVQSARKLLEAERANLRSRIDMEITTPDLQMISEQKYNSELQRDVVVWENSRLWQMNMSIRQPVILFGYPTNGYISLNNTVYRLSQIGDEGKDITYYNRYFIEYEQPLFQPNWLKNDLEMATLDLEEEELQYHIDIVNVIGDIAEDYLNLFETAYERLILENQIENLELALEAARNNITEATNAVDQIQVELANVQQSLKQAESDFRLEGAQIKQELRLFESDSLTIDPVIEINPVQLNVKQAIGYGIRLRPLMRDLEIEERRQEIDVEEEKGENSFQLNIEATYGREMQDPRFDRIFNNPANSYTLRMTAQIPLWDWGERKARIQAEQLDLKRTQLQMEEEEVEIRSDIRNAVETLREYQNRSLAMQENLQLARSVTQTSLEDFKEEQVGVSALILNIQRQRDTEENLLEAYLGYRQEILDLQELTFYDFETGQPLLDRYKVEVQE